MNKLLLPLITIFLLNSNLFANPNLNARTGILVDYHSDEILFEMDPDAQIYPASMTKIMTSIVAFDLLKKNKLSLDDLICSFRKCMETFSSWILINVYND